jgi:hypothetical protein
LNNLSNIYNFYLSGLDLGMNIIKDLLTIPQQPYVTRGDDVVFDISYDTAFAGETISFRMVAPDEFSSYFTFYGNLSDDGENVYTDWDNLILDASGNARISLTTNPDSYEVEWSLQLQYDSTSVIAASSSVIINESAPTAADTNQLVGLEDNDFLGVLAEGSDADGNTLSYLPGSVEPTHGAVTIESDGNFTYSPKENFYGSDTFSYVVTDGKYQSEEATAYITIKRVDDPPVGVLPLIIRTSEETDVWAAQGPPQVIANSPTEYTVIAHGGYKGYNPYWPNQAEKLLAKLPSGQIIEIVNYENESWFIKDWAADSFPDGSWVVFWETSRPGGGGAQRYSSEGEPIGSLAGVGSGGPLATSHNGSVLLVNGNATIILEADWWETSVEIGPGAWERGIFNAKEVTALADGSWLLTNNLTGARLDEEGSFVEWLSLSGPDTSFDSNMGYSAAAGLTDGGWVITWPDTHRNIKAQVFSADGSPIGDEITVNSSTDGDRYNNDVVALGNGGFIVTWDYNRDPYVGYWPHDNLKKDVYAREFSADGQPVSDEFYVNLKNEGNQTHANVVRLSETEWVAAWQTDLNGVFIESQKFSSDLKQGYTISTTGDSITDVDGLPQYKWYRFLSDGEQFSGGRLSGKERSGSVVLSEQEVGTEISVIVYYGNPQNSLTSLYPQPVQNINDIPVISSNPANRVPRDELYKYQMIYTDVDANDTVTLASSDLPAWLTFDDSTGLLSGTPTKEDVGKYDITLTAIDEGGLSAEQTFILMVTKIPDVYSWSSHQLLSRIRENENGGFKASVIDNETGSAINSADALAALKMSVGLNPNQNGFKTSPYQFIAADMNQDGKVTSADALSILKIAVNLPDAPTKEWTLVSEKADFFDETQGRFRVTKNDIDWASILDDIAQHDPDDNLVAVLKGDVNGSWAGSGDLASLSSNYFSALASEDIGPIEQWWVV